MTKREQWQLIQIHAPDLAAFLTALNAAFGKVRLVRWEVK